MPGVKSVIWTEKNKAKALDALLNFATVKIGDEVADLIATHVGEGCKPKAIHSLLANTRRRFVPENGVPATSKTSRAAASVTSRISPSGGFTKPSTTKTSASGGKRRTNKPVSPPKSPNKKGFVKNRDSESEAEMTSDSGAGVEAGGRGSEGRGQGLVPVLKMENGVGGAGKGCESMSMSPSPSPSPAAKRRSTPRAVNRVDYLAGQMGDEDVGGQEDSEPSDAEYHSRVDEMDEDGNGDWEQEVHY